MRTIVTLEKDIERMVRHEMHRTRRSFKETLNATLRLGFAGKAGEPTASRFVIRPRALGLRAGIAPTSFNKLADELEVDAFLVKSRRERK